MAFLGSVMLCMSALGADGAILLNVDISDFYDGNPATNNIVITASGSAPSTAVTDNGNFPQVHLKGFFTVDQNTPGETTSIGGGLLRDFVGREFTNLYTSNQFVPLFEGIFGPDPWIPAPTDLGILAGNRLNMDFDTAQPAFSGSATWDMGVRGWVAGDFNLTGGTIEAQDFPFVEIGQYSVTIPEPSASLLLGVAGLGLLARRRRAI